MWLSHTLLVRLLTLQVLHLLFLLCQVGRMGERAAGGPGPAISPGQQMMASGTGAMLTSIFGEIMTSVLCVSVSLRRLKHVTVFTVTPLDVVKIRLQAQQTAFHRGQTALPLWF